MIVINWMTLKSRMENLVACPIYDEIKASLSVFNSICIGNFYRELNMDTIILSKKCLQLDEDSGPLIEKQGGVTDQEH